MQKGAENPNHDTERTPEHVHRSAEDLLTENARLHQRVAWLEAKGARLSKQAATLREQFNKQVRAQQLLQQQLAEIESQNTIFAPRYMEVEDLNTHLTMLYTACQGLHSTLDRQAVLNVIQEIIINLVGSEELAIFEIGEDGQMLQLIEYFGVDPVLYEFIPLGMGLIGRTALSGEMYIAESTPDDGLPDDGLPEEEGLTACIPLLLEGRVIGLIAVFRLLAQKSGIEVLDRELFELLKVHAATALYCTSLHQRESVISSS